MAKSGKTTCAWEGCYDMHVWTANQQLPPHTVQHMCPRYDFGIEWQFHCQTTNFCLWNLRFVLGRFKTKLLERGAPLWRSSNDLCEPICSLKSGIAIVQFKSFLFELFVNWSHIDTMNSTSVSQFCTITSLYHGDSGLVVLFKDYRNLSLSKWFDHIMEIQGFAEESTGTTWRGWEPL